MTAIPPPIHQTKTQVLLYWERKQNSKPRNYLGASIIGKPCARHIWYQFRNAREPLFEGRMLRLFNTGHREEPRIIEELRGIGCHVVDEDPASPGNQISVSALSGHFKGHLDAMIEGLPEAPKTWHVGEFKTHNEKSFKKLQDKGVEEAKPEHYAQMQIYMGLTDTSRALYYAVNKNDDDIYVERIEFNKELFDRYIARAKMIIQATEPPGRISNDPSWFECKLCDDFNHCHGTKVPLPNCRTCAHSTPVLGDKDGEWHCSKNGPSIHSHDAQLVGCDMHRYIPSLLEKFAEMTDANDEGNWVKYKNKITGAEFYNGDLSSKEIYSCNDKSMLGDPVMNELRYEMGAEIVS